jgi:uncharacterized protein (DUF2062 family)
VRRFLPTPEGIKDSRLLSWLGPRLHEPGLWHFNRRAVARGVAIGLFFGLIIPVAQIVAASAVAFFARANLWVSAITTLVTNPFTFAPIYFVAYKLGAFLLGGSDAALAIEEVDPEMISAVNASLEQASRGISGWLDKLMEIFTGYGKPLALGLAVLAVTMSIAGYAITMVVWRIAVVLKQRRRACRPRTGA